MEIVYGTQNKNKVEQLKRIIRRNKLKLNILSAEDINFHEEIEETGTTFEENSFIKAQAIKKFCDENGYKNRFIVTDDSGLCVDVLDGRPGIYTARYAGKNPTQMQSIEKLLGELKKYPNSEDRKCKLVCVMTCIKPDGEILVSRGESFGTISDKIGPLGGLTFGPVFIPEGFNKSLNELDEKEEMKTNTHREKAIKGLVDLLKEDYV